MHRVLLVDDKQTMVSFLSTVLKRHGFEVVPACNGLEALAAFVPGTFDAVVSDLRMEPVNGIELLTALREKQADLVFILMTAYGEINSAVDAMKHGVFDCLIKPFDVSALLTTLRRGMAYRQALTGTLDLRMLVGSYHHMGDLVAESASMREVCATIQHLAPLDVSVLISGENGTGKALIARTLHDYSNRRDLPFLEIDCGVLKETLGTAGTRPDRGKKTDRGCLTNLLGGGTLFLNSVDVMPADVQQELVRELWELVPVDATAADRNALPRIIASTAIDPDELVAVHNFDGELCRIIGGSLISVPPLRERSEDILPLVYHIASRELGNTRALPTLGTVACGVIGRYAWPGNAGELEACVKTAIGGEEDGTIVRDSLPEHILSAVGPDADKLDLKEEFFHAAFLKQFLKAEQQQVSLTIHEKAARYMKEKKIHELTERDTQQAP